MKCLDCGTEMEQGTVEGYARCLRIGRSKRKPG